MHNEDRAPRDEDRPDLAPTRRTHFVAPDASVPPQAPHRQCKFKTSVGTACMDLISLVYGHEQSKLFADARIVFAGALDVFARFEIYSWTLGMRIDVGIWAAAHCIRRLALYYAVCLKPIAHSMTCARPELEDAPLQ